MRASYLYVCRSEEGKEKYFDGLTPVTLKKALEKWLGLAKPSSLAIWVTVMVCSLRSWMAYSILQFKIYSLGDRPRLEEKIRYRQLSLIPQVRLISEMRRGSRRLAAI